MTDHFEAVLETFRRSGDPIQAVPMAAYMRDQFPFLGIRTQDRRALAKSFLKDTKKEPLNWDFVDRCWAEDQREFQYLVCEYLRVHQRELTPQDLPHLKRLIVTKSWWDTIDGLDRIVGAVALEYPVANQTILAWSQDENFWVRRIAIDHQLLRKEKTDTDLLEQILVNNFGSKEFFINKAIGWSLRDYSKTDPVWVAGFLARHGEQMAPLSVREASKYV